MSVVPVASFTPPSPGELAPLFPGYLIHGLIASGGMGSVYLATQTALDRKVAIKILPQELVSDESFRTSFATEAKAMGRLNHPNLVAVHDSGEAGELLFTVMEYLPRGSMYDAVHGQQVDPAAAAEIVTGICAGLAHAHDRGILHRDIKPSNILFNEENQPKLADFGLARAVGRQHEVGETIYGTPHYTAPEVTRPPYRPQTGADVFSLGVILYELLTGKLPHADPRPASAISGCDPRFDAIIARATNPSPALRYASARELAADLETILKASSSRKPAQLRTSPAPSSALSTPSFAKRTGRNTPRKFSSASQGPPIATIVIVVLILLAIVLLIAMTSSSQ
jgi:serine/threonine protein kinase